MPHAELAEVTPVLLETGAGGLGWWRIRGTPLQRCAAGRQLQQAYRLQSILSEVRQRELLEAVRALRAADVEPVLVKGWSVARLYPETGLRPYGDVDLSVRPGQRGVAEAALSERRDQGCPVDLEEWIPRLDDRPVDEVWRRTRLAAVGGVAVRVLGAEDQLRFLSWHLLDHGAWRPLWLCDIAAALESRPSDFDWEYALSGLRQRSHGVLCALALANQLLGARLEGTPLAGGGWAPPRWLVPGVLQQWGKGFRHREPLVYHLRQRSGVFESLRQCWPDPITATVGVRAPFNRMPRWPFQVGQCVKRAAQIVVELTRPAPS
jgi:hypothetical protein